MLDITNSPLLPNVFFFLSCLLPFILHGQFFDIYTHLFTQIHIVTNLLPIAFHMRELLTTVRVLITWNTSHTAHIPFSIFPVPPFPLYNVVYRYSVHKHLWVQRKHHFPNKSVFSCSYRLPLKNMQEICIEFSDMNAVGLSLHVDAQMFSTFFMSIN